MGEKKGANSDGEKKSAGGGGGGAVVVVLKMDVHCDACAKKVKKLVAGFSGVEDVNIDTAGNKLTVTGKVDPVKLRQRLEDKTHKRVELVSPQPKKDGGAAGDKKPEEKKKAAEDKKPVETTVALKFRLHCDGCMKKVRKVISKINGVDSVGMDASKDLVTVKGTMDVKELVPYLQDKLKQAVEAVLPKKDDAGKGKSGGGGGDKKAKDAAAAEKNGDGAGKAKTQEPTKEVSSGGPQLPPMMEISRMEYGGYSMPPPPMYWSDRAVYGGPYGQHVAVPYQYQGGPPSQENYPPAVHYVGSGYSMDPYAVHGHTQMFSDENPNAACSIM